MNIPGHNTHELSMVGVNNDVIFNPDTTSSAVLVDPVSYDEPKNRMYLYILTNRTDATHYFKT